MAKRRAIGPTAWVLGGAGVFIGAVAAWLVSQGNPGNMGLCIACFLRDITGFFVGGTTNQAAVAYIRPEIVGIILGALGAALATREFRARGGSQPVIRFVLGFIFMSGALIFLGCTVRAWLRLGGGDLSAIWGIGGIVAGVLVGVVFLKRGFNLGRARAVAAPFGWLLPLIGVALLALLLISTLGTKPNWATVTPENGRAVVPGKVVVAPDGDGLKVLKPADEDGNPTASIVDGAVVADDGTVLADAATVAATKPMPGGKRAPLWISLAAGLAIGVVAQRSRFCSIGGIRDAVLVRRYDLLFGVVGLVVGATVVNMLMPAGAPNPAAYAQVGQWTLGFEGQPVAHNDALGSFAAMTVATLAAVLLGGCPFRQVIMGAEGDADSFMAVAGMLVGAGATHFYNLASSPLGLAENAWPALGAMAVVVLAIAVFGSRKTA